MHGLHGPWTMDHMGCHMDLLLMTVMTHNARFQHTTISQPCFLRLALLLQYQGHVTYYGHIWRTLHGVSITHGTHVTCCHAAGRYAARMLYAGLHVLHYVVDDRAYVAVFMRGVLNRTCNQAKERRESIPSSILPNDCPRITDHCIHKG